MIIKHPLSRLAMMSGISLVGMGCVLMSIELANYCKPLRFGRPIQHALPIADLLMWFAVGALVGVVTLPFFMLLYWTNLKISPWLVYGLSSITVFLYAFLAPFVASSPVKYIILAVCSVSVLSVCTSFAWRVCLPHQHERRCPACGYAMHGLRDRGCPECGWHRAVHGSTNDDAAGDVLGPMETIATAREPGIMTRLVEPPMARTEPTHDEEATRPTPSRNRRL